MHWANKEFGTIEFIFSLGLLTYSEWTVGNESSDDEDEKKNLARGVGRGKKKKLWPLSKDDTGTVVLPSFEAHSLPSLEDRKDIIRSFFTHSYRKLSTLASLLYSYTRTGEFTRNLRAAVPWGNIVDNPEKWIKGWDASIVVKEPSKMVASEVNAIYKYLLERQSTGSRVIGWVRVSEKDEDAWKSVDGSHRGQSGEREASSFHAGGKSGDAEADPSKDDDGSQDSHLEGSDDQTKRKIVPGSPVGLGDPSDKGEDSGMEVPEPSSAMNKNNKRSISPVQKSSPAKRQKKSPISRTVAETR